MALDNHSKIVSSFNSIKMDKILLIKCSNINQRSAINRLAFYKGFKTKAVSSDLFHENFIYNYGNNLLRFSDIEWDHEDGDDYDYFKLYQYDSDDSLEDDNTIMYYWGYSDRFEEFETEEKIVGLDFNAVVVYPKIMNAKYKDINEFSLRKNHFNHTNKPLVKKLQINTDELEKEYINGIKNMKIEKVSFYEYLINK
jgi:hypothetical protein